MLDKSREGPHEEVAVRDEAPQREAPVKQDERAAPDQEARNRDEEATDAPRSKPGVLGTLRAHPFVVGFVVLALIIATVGGVLYYMYEGQFETTDDAFIDGRVVTISPQVVGDITEVPVTDNEIVHAGDLLARIDPRDYQAAVAQADAQIAQADAAIATANAQEAQQQAQIKQAANQITVAQANLTFSTEENKRYQQEVKSGAGTVQRAQQAATDLEAKQAALYAAQDTHAAALRQVAVIQAQRKSAEAQKQAAEAQKQAAEANLSRTELRSPVDGRVTRLTGAVGQLATQGAALMIIVPTHIWVTANFKETQLAEIRLGQPVDIEVDAYGRTFQGRVNSVQAGSGTAFSLLPAENATGNYVKVVQRIPVKITFDKMPEVELGPGMSVVPTVRVKPPCALCGFMNNLF